jgi:acyl-CoA reductase-like NAD-dependent aldehyde dehydrogenase
MCKTYRMLVNGSWVDALGGAWFDDLNPYTGEVFGKVAAGGADDTRRAIDAAAAAFPGWAATSPSERRRVLLKAADLLQARGSEFAAALTDETGATVNWARFQTHLAGAILMECASQVHRVTGQVIPADLPGQFSMTVRRPVGVVAGIGPWNAPLVLCLRSVAYPLAYGNSAILKPSAEAPVSGGVLIASLFEEAGLPAGVLNLVINGPGKSGEVGDVLVSDPRVKRISFTGSSEAGRRIAEQAGRHLKRVTLELGGNDAVVVLADADIDYAVSAAAFGRFTHQGQICMSSKRIIVEAPVAEEFTRKFVSRAGSLKAGDPRDAGTYIGPLINRAQLELLVGQVEQAVREGAVIACGGRFENLLYYPTVLTGVNREMSCFREEVFGPVASVIVAKDADEAVDLANDTPYGLSAGVITRDLQKGLDLAERLQTGSVHVNDSSIGDEAQVPFGGIKASGYGKHGGLECIEEFTELKWVTYQKVPREFPI